MTTKTQSLDSLLNEAKRQVVGVDPRDGKGHLWIEAVSGYLLYILPLAALWLSMVNGWTAIIVIVILRASGFILIGDGPMHTGSHGGFSTSAKVNKWAGRSMTILGMSADDAWYTKHNLLHHTETNIHLKDDDITAGDPFIRFTPYSNIKHFLISYQHYYFPIIYMISFINWILVSDYKMLIRYHRDGLGSFKNNQTKQALRSKLAKITTFKAIYFFAHFGPMLIGVPFWICLASWIGTMALAGLIFMLVFQLAHITDEVTMYQNDYKKPNFFRHQLATTANFTFYYPWLDRLMTSLLGGLNHQIEHHLWCNVSPYYYPALSKKVKEIVDNYTDTTEHEQVRYVTRPVHIALYEHWKYLRHLGKTGTPLSMSMG